MTSVSASTIRLSLVVVPFTVPSLHGTLRTRLSAQSYHPIDPEPSSTNNRFGRVVVSGVLKNISTSLVQASFLRLLKIIEELRRSDFGNRSSGQMRGSLNWRENSQRGSRSRARDGAYSWLQRGMQSSRFHFDETLNDVIHGMYTPNMLRG